MAATRATTAITTEDDQVGVHDDVERQRSRKLNASAHPPRLDGAPRDLGSRTDHALIPTTIVPMAAANGMIHVLFFSTFPTAVNAGIRYWLRSEITCWMTGINASPSDALKFSN